MQKVTIIPGDGIGPEVMEATLRILAAAGSPLEWEKVEAGEKVIEREGTPLPAAVLDSIKRNKVALKGPITTPVGKGFKSVNVTLRKELNLYANLRPVKNLPNVRTRFENVDLVVVRENTEDLYVGIERQVEEGRAEAIKIISADASKRIAHFAFEYAKMYNRRKVTAVHKANILKLTDGLFLECCKEAAQDYPQIKFEEKIVDNMCMQLVQFPESFDILVMPNLYGDILSDLAAGLVGGLGLVPGANIGDDAAVFEAVHGSAPDIAGMNKANPIALLLSACMMLDYLKYQDISQRIRTAVDQVLLEGQFITCDLGGSSSTNEITEAIMAKL
ncbi:isocitrate/isopropylmalate dehydrogenase family protein [Desulfitibacter alkalitolerans]|uniref:isocitrate/isopropylmalate dehydrogenase family protein n=1 Tax=Desulfitibacter alkalitolerans TaxID=264641 RepID=UPI00047F853D|nr:isocitrate/isopropylmalate dehydrogenase family protein [Desulfitibacter alkalitolerans]